MCEEAIALNVIIVAGENASVEHAVTQWPDHKRQVFHDIKTAIDYACSHSYDLVLLDTRLSETCLDEMRTWMGTQKQQRPILLMDSQQLAETGLCANVWSLNPVPIRDSEPPQEPPAQAPPAQLQEVLLYVQCFGNFEVFRKDRTRLRFKRRKSKELFAYLILRRGAACSNTELAAILFEDDSYDAKRQQYLQKIIASLRETLEEAGAAGVLVRSYGHISVDVNKVQCDYYQFTQNDTEILRSWAGEFMLQYSWAEPVAGYISSAAGGIS